MKSIYGDLKSLRASERTLLEKILSKKVNPKDYISQDLFLRVSEVVRKLKRTIGVIIQRDGKVSHVVLGKKDRIYLPDLGRYRLSKERLRKLRLFIFSPEGESICRWCPKNEVLDSSKIINLDKYKKEKKELVFSPILKDDLRADLEKLRFDILAVISVTNNPKELSPITLCYLEPYELSKSFFNSSSSTTTLVKTFSVKSIYDLKMDFLSFIKDLEKRFSSLRTKIFDTNKELAVLVGVYTENKKRAYAYMEELKELCRTSKIEVVDTIVQKRKFLDPKTVLGKGKIEEVVLHCLDLGAELLVFDRELSPAQLRSITKLTELRVIDRSMLILDIFANRAKSSEAKLQVELAQLKYSYPMLTDKDSGLSRLTGKIGGRGPGETKLEIRRRRARDRIALLEKKIDEVSSRRGLRREKRISRGVPVVSIVGYTNAGKSTLLNSLTKSNVFVEGKLFATLDPSTRRMRFPNDKEVVLVDTVGFIRELPKELVNAFRSTLEEIGEADLLLHVVDCSDIDLKEHIKVVKDTLRNLNFNKKPSILVLNKVDLLSPIEVLSIKNSLNCVCVSAKDKIGFQELVESIKEELLKTFKGQDPGRFLELSSSLV